MYRESDLINIGMLFLYQDFTNFHMPLKIFLKV